MGHRNAPAYTAVQTVFEEGDPEKPYPQITAPFSGYLLLSKALGGNGQAQFANVQRTSSTDTTCATKLKAYALVLPQRRILNIVLLNKGDKEGCWVSLSLQGRYGNGTLTRLLSGHKGLHSFGCGITYAGRTYCDSKDGSLLGKYKATRVRGVWDGTEHTVMAFKVPPASAAILSVRLVEHWPT